MSQAHVRDQDLDTHFYLLAEIDRGVEQTTAELVRLVQGIDTQTRNEAEARRRRAGSLESSKRVRENREEQWTSAEQHALDTALRASEAANSAARTVQSAADAARRAAYSLERHTRDYSTRGRAFLQEKMDPTHGYLRTSPSAGASSATTGSAATLPLARGGSVGAAPAVPGHDWASMVTLAFIDDSDSTVRSAADFGKTSATDLSWSLESLQYVVLPAVRQGLGSDFFAQRDAAEGNVGSRSHAETYRGYLGDGSRAIQLTLRPDGRYEVTNGYHRLWLARAAGLDSIPARVRGAQ